MIHDLDNTLKALLDEKLKLTFPSVEIQISPPESVTISSNPVVSLFLNYSQERKELRGTGEKVRKDPSNVSYQIAAPLWIDFGYQINCWVDESMLSQVPFSGEGLTVFTAEHWLFTEVIKTLSCYATIPDIYFQGSLAGADAENEILETQLFTPESIPNTTSNITKLGMNYTVTLGLRIHEEKSLGTPVEERNINTTGI